MPCLGISFKYRFDGNLFNERRLNAQTKTSVTHSYELQCADDTALVSHTADGLQQLLDSMVDAYSHAGLVVNIKKTEILKQCTSPNLAPPFFSMKDCPVANVDQFVSGPSPGFSSRGAKKQKERPKTRRGATF